VSAQHRQQATVNVADPRGAARRPAVTLAELAVSIAVTGLLAGAIVSSILIASHALPERSAATTAVIGDTALLQDLATDLAEAVSFTQRNAQSVEFMVPDRTGDGNADVLRYAWSGTAGDPLTRQINGGTVAPLAPAVQAFSLAYGVDTVSVRQRESSATTSDLTLLANFDGWGAVTPTAEEFSLSTSSWAAEYFEPAIPSGTLEMTITEVSLYLRKTVGDSPGDLWIEIYAPGGGSTLPAGSPLGSSAMVSNTSIGTSYSWVSFPFTNVTINWPRGGYVLVAKATTVGPAARAFYYRATAAPADSTIMLWTTDGGATWNPPSSSMNQYDMFFQVHGTYSTRSVREENRSLYFLRSVTATLRSDARATVAARTTARVLNAPEVSGP
jgi:hypothetical protein